MCMPPAHDPGALAERRWRAVDLPRIRRLDDSWEIRLSWHGHSPRGRRGLCSSGDRPRMLRSISRRSCSGPISGRFPAPISRERSADRSNLWNEALNGRTLDPSGNERRTLEPSGNGASHGRTVREHGVARTDRPGTGHRAAGRSGLSPARRRPRSWRRSASALCGRQSGLRPARRPSRSLRWRVRRSRGSRRRRAARGWPRVRGSHGAPRRGGYGVAR